MATEFDLKVRKDPILNIGNQELQQKYLDRINGECFSGDTEEDHVNLDNALLDLLQDLGFEELIGRAVMVDKWFA